MRQLDRSDRALVALLPPQVSAEIDRWRSLYYPSFQVVPPHITVAYPPFVPVEDWARVQPLVAQCLRGFAPFSVQLAHLGVFHGDPSYLWLKPEDGGCLMRLHQTLVERFPQYMPDLDFAYCPHVTIGAFSSARELRAARQAVSAAWQPCQFEVRQLVYLAPDEGGVWCVCSRLPLGRA